MSDPLWATIYHTPFHLHPFFAEVLHIFGWAFIGLLASRVFFEIEENIAIWYAKFKGRWRWWCTRCEWLGVCSKAHDADAVYCNEIHHQLSKRGGREALLAQRDAIE